MDPSAAGAGPVPTRPDPPAVLVRLAPGASPEAVREGLSTARSAGRIRQVESPFAGLLTTPVPSTEGGIPRLDSGAADEPLARIRRIVLEPGVDPGAMAAALRSEPGIEAAWVERRYRVAWEGAEGFLGPAPAASGSAGPSPGAPAAGVIAPNDPLFVDGSQWGLENAGTGPFGGVAGADIRARAGWAVTSGSTALTLGIVDTGCDLEQPEIGGTLADGSPRIVRAFNSSIEGPYGSPADSVGHGTMVTGVAVARTNDGARLDGRGVAGVAGGAGGDSAGCRVIVVKATPTRLLDALSTELAKGIVYAVTYGARAINLSFGGDDDDDTLLDAISYAARRGVVVVCGAGNALDDRPQYPGYYARYGAGLSIAALRVDGTLARFSSRGPQIDVAAPGEDIWSAYLTYANAYANPTRNYAYTSGTSFAAPFVTGLAGLATTLQPSLTDNEFQQLLRHTARDVGAPGRDDTFGWGVPDAGALLAYAAPPRGFVRGTVAAQTWTLLGTDSVTLAKTRLVSDGCSVDGRYLAERWAVEARVSLPPGRFLETPLGLARTHASNGWTANSTLEYDLGYGEVVPGSASPEGFTLRAYVYRIDAPPQYCSHPTTSIGFVPVAPQDVTFGWSAFGRLDAEPAVRITEPAADGATWTVGEPETLRWEASDPDTVSTILVSVRRRSVESWEARAVLPGDARSFVLTAQCAVPGESTFVRVTAYDLHGGVQEMVSAERSITPSRECAPGEDSDGGPVTLFPVAPNPSHGAVTLRYQRGGLFQPLGRGARVELAPPPLPELLEIHDVRGRRLRSYALGGESVGAITWDGRDESGRRVPNGVYLARLRTGGEIRAQRFVLLGATQP